MVEGIANVTSAQLLAWAAQLVRIVCFADLSRDVENEVAEPVRRIALQMRDVATQSHDAITSSKEERVR